MSTNFNMSYNSQRMTDPRMTANANALGLGFEQPTITETQPQLVYDPILRRWISHRTRTVSGLGLSGRDVLVDGCSVYSNVARVQPIQRRVINDGIVRHCGVLFRVIHYSDGTAESSRI